MTLAVFFEIISPQATDKKDNGRKRNVEDKRLQIHVVELCKINSLKACILQIPENGMMNNDNQNDGQLNFPILIRDKNGAADKSHKVHLEHAMHLVNKLSHENAKHRTQYILIQI